MSKTESTKAAPERKTDTEDSVTELAHVDASTTLGEMKEMSGATDKDASPQQRDALEGLKQAKDDILHPDKADDSNPHIHGPGGDI